MRRPIKGLASFCIKRGKRMNDQPEVTGATTEAEESLIGAILLESAYDDGNAIRQIKQIIEPWDFNGCTKSDKPWQWIWRARIYYAMTLCEVPPTEIIVTHKLIDLNMLQKEDRALLSHCVWVTPCSLDYLIYAGVVKDYSIRRQAKYLADRGDIEGMRRITKYNRNIPAIEKQIQSSGVL